ncbi:MAG: pyruvate dehydrogenase (acetyl-transferring) E1 component subunit alpha [Acidobacteriota bacterium]
MPRKEIDLPYRVDYLAILDQDGQVDKELDPGLDDAFLLKLYRAMLLARRFDERMLILQRQGRLGTFAPIKGQEAQVGTVAALRPDDWVIPSFREMPSELWRGKRMETVLLFYSGYNEGGYIPKDMPMLPVAIPVGTQMLHAAGIGYAMKYSGKDQVAMTFFGDGATSEGDFHEAMNFAAVFQTPTIFICQNNHWAISVPRHKQTHAGTLAQKSIAYGMPGMQVDGNDVLALYVAAREAIERARSGGGPTLIEAVTYRLSLHTTADDPKKYRKEEEVAKWAVKDPIARFEKYLTGKGLLSEEKIKSLDDEVKAEIKAAENRWAEIVEKGIDPLDMFDHLYEERPPYLEEQFEELRRELEEKRGGTTQKPTGRS